MTTAALSPFALMAHALLTPEQEVPHEARVGVVIGQAGAAPVVPARRHTRDTPCWCQTGRAS